MLREVTLPEILEERERRVFRQQELIAKFNVPVISFTLNIAGPIKDSPLIRRGFYYGCQQLEGALAAMKLPVLSSEKFLSHTGCEAIYAVNGDLMRIKRLCVSIEDANSIGRLFDMDVIAPDGKKIDREVVGGLSRDCIVCGKPGRGCASRRVHSVSELQNATRNILTSHFESYDRELIASIATESLLNEVCTTPKPGLVDRNNSGSHKDMDIFTFMTSASHLYSYWKDCVETGQNTADLPPTETFKKLRTLGQKAERNMFSATHGVNTHKGAIFALGIICGAIGRLWSAENPCRDPKTILSQCGEMTSSVLFSELSNISDGGEALNTAGEKLYAKYKMDGVRGEAARGFPSILNVSLPALENALDAGCSMNDAGAVTLLHLIAIGNDTNMVSRGGVEVAEEAVNEVRELLNRSPLPSVDEISELDESFISKNLSPGGCADLLAATYFLHSIKE